MIVRMAAPILVFAHLGKMRLPMRGHALYLLAPSNEDRLASVWGLVGELMWQPGIAAGRDEEAVGLAATSRSGAGFGKAIC